MWDKDGSGRMELKFVGRGRSGRRRSWSWISDESLDGDPEDVELLILGVGRSFNAVDGWDAGEIGFVPKQGIRMTSGWLGVLLLAGRRWFGFGCVRRSRKKKTDVEDAGSKSG